jgi:hypothetical protein
LVREGVEDVPIPKPKEEMISEATLNMRDTQFSLEQTSYHATPIPIPEPEEVQTF